ncbi:MAG: caspase family protein [Rhodocyclales bacterium]|nr:caspase family protein [Rhodocyclales bacterium]
MLALICTVAALSGPTPAFAQRNAPESLKRVALVIGNGAYPVSPLKNPVNDARAISRALKDLGFDVTHRENLNQKSMADVIRQFGARLTPGTAAVFYYAGHGMQVQGRNFLIPVDADVQAEDEVPYSTIDVGLLLGKMEQAKSPANIVILDACRDNPFARRFRPANTGLAQMDAPIGTLLAYATAPGSVARDGGENGVYTKHLVANLNSEGLAVEQLFKRVRVAVAQETRETQVPWESSSLKGEFVFKEAPRGKTAASQDQMIEEAVRAAAERAATLTAERMAREQASRPAPAQESQAARQESERLATERESLRQERQRLETDRATLRTETARAETDRATLRTETARAEAAKKEKAPVPAKAPVARVSPPAPLPAAAPAPQRSGGANPEVGDAWTYRFSDGYGKGGTFTVRITDVSAEEISDEARMGNSRHAGTFSPGLALSGRSFSGLSVREISPYLQSLGPLEATADWKSITILSGGDPFAARFAGTETVTVPAGTFETRKLVIEGRETLKAAYGNPTRPYTVTVWYAPAAKRFVKLSFHTPSGTAYPGENDTIELVETNFAMNMAVAPTPVAAAKPAESQRTAFFGRSADTGGGSLDKAGLPKTGDSWTYRFSDGYSKSGSYTVRVAAVSGDEVSDEARVGNSRVTVKFQPGLAMSSRTLGGLAIREISPYLQSLGPTEPTEEWRNVNVLSGEAGFRARLAGAETVQVPAGTFEARKVVIEGTQVLRAAYGNPSRSFTVTVWYAPAAKRFVKLTVSAPSSAFPAEHDLIELTEFKLN